MKLDRYEQILEINMIMDRFCSLKFKIQCNTIYQGRVNVASCVLVMIEYILAAEIEATVQSGK